MKAYYIKLLLQSIYSIYYHKLNIKLEKYLFLIVKL